MQTLDTLINREESVVILKLVSTIRSNCYGCLNYWIMYENKEQAFFRKLAYLCDTFDYKRRKSKLLKMDLNKITSIKVPNQFLKHVKEYNKFMSGIVNNIKLLRYIIKQ